MVLKGKSIYIADDDENVLDALSTVLEAEGANVFRSTDGQKIFTAVTFGKPDCIIMDLYMPQSNGFISIQAMKELLNIDCPILVLTGHGTEENINKAKALGATECMLKPLKAGDLIHTVLKLISSSDVT